MAASNVLRSCGKSPLFEKFLLHNGAMVRPAACATSRAFSTAAAEPTFVPMKVPSIDELSPAEKVAMSEDLDGVCMLPHFRTQHVDIKSSSGGMIDWRLPHPVWSRDELENQDFVHCKPQGLADRAALATVMTLRKAYDLFTGYSLGFQNEKCMLRRVIFLETVAGVPGMVGAMNRHLLSLRSMNRDHGWIHTLLEEAENERMHLMIAMCLRKPSWIIRTNVLIAQGFFLTWYSIMYALSPKFCHRFVGYLEEQAVHTYTNIVNKIDMGELPGFEAPAPTAVRKYYRLDAESTLRDVFLAMRADENHHREVNHTFAEMKPNCANPFPPGF